MKVHYTTREEIYYVWNRTDCATYRAHQAARRRATRLLLVAVALVLVAVVVPVLLAMAGVLR